jgi:hypothetical protein
MELTLTRMTATPRLGVPNVNGSEGRRARLFPIFPFEPVRGVPNWTDKFLIVAYTSANGGSSALASEKFTAQDWRNFEAQEPKRFPSFGLLFGSTPGRRGHELSAEAEHLHAR